MPEENMDQCARMVEKISRDDAIVRIAIGVSIFVAVIFEVIFLNANFGILIAAITITIGIGLSIILGIGSHLEGISCNWK